MLRSIKITFNFIILKINMLPSVYQLKSRIKFGETWRGWVWLQCAPCTMAWVCDQAGSSAWCPAARHSAWKLGPKTLANLVKWWMLLITFLLTFSLSLSKLKFHEVPPSETKWKNNEEWLQPKQNVEQMIHGDLKIEQPLLRFNLKKHTGKKYN